MSQPDTTNPTGGEESMGWESLALTAAGRQVEEEESLLRDLLTFTLNGDSYAVPVEWVREIVRLRGITPMPRVPPEIRGVISLRGEIVQVLDLCRRLGIGSREPARSNRIIVLHGDPGNVTGLLVDSVKEVLRVDEEAIQIREIVRSQEVTPLPRAPELIEGVVDLRGVVVPVIDLGHVLCGERTENSPESRIAILEVDGMVLGLRVDAAVDVLGVEAGDVDAPPALATHAGYDKIRAVVRRADAPPVLVLSLESILESVYRSALTQGGVEA